MRPSGTIRSAGGMTSRYHERVVFILVVVMALIVLAMIVVFTYVAVRALIDRWSWRSL